MINILKDYNYIKLHIEYNNGGIIDTSPLTSLLGTYTCVKMILDKVAHDRYSNFKVDDSYVSLSYNNDEKMISMNSTFTLEKFIEACEDTYKTWRSDYYGCI